MVTPADAVGSARTRRTAAATARVASSGLEVGAPKVSNATVPLSPPVTWITSPPSEVVTRTTCCIAPCGSVSGSETNTVVT